MEGNVRDVSFAGREEKYVHNAHAQMPKKEEEGRQQAKKQNQKGHTKGGGTGKPANQAREV